MIKHITITLMAFFVFFTLAFAGEGTGIKEGQWEVTVKIHSPELEMHFPPFVSTQCITAADAVPQSPQPGADTCKVTEQKVSGDTVTWALTCDVKQSGYTTGTGKVTYSGETFTGQLVFKNENNLEITSNMTGKYMGPCKK